MSIHIQQILRKGLRNTNSKLQWVLKVNMKSVINRRKSCRMCNSENLELVFQLAPSPIGDAYVTAEQLDEVQDSYPIDLFLCRECGLSQLLDVIAPEVLYREYIYQTGNSFGLLDHFQSYAEDLLERFVPKLESLVVDVGSNDGTLLSCFKERGMKVLGVDPAEDIAARATASGIETLPDFFTPELATTIRREYGPAALVTANNVFANIDDLTPIAESARILLAEDGVFSFESFYLADLVQNMVFDFIYHEHISAFAVKPVRLFFERLGLELFDVKHVPTKGGSLRYMVQLAGASRPVSPRIAEYIDREGSQGLYQPSMFKAFSQKITNLKSETLALLEDLKRDGRVIAAFGASVTGTTLIHHFELGDYIDFLIDDNVTKQGRFSPGLHIPVYAPDMLYDRKPDYVLILAWRFVEPIVKKHGKFIEQGGRFIVPVPELKII
jgi:SAM-dependent methyltransferase